MREVLLLFAIRIRLTVNRLRSLHQESRLKVAVVAFLGTVLWFGLFLLFYRGFAFLDTFVGPDNPFTTAMLALFFISLLLMLFFSNAIITYSSLFRSDESTYLLTCPLAHQAVFLHKFTESLLFSSWAFLLLAGPLTLAYGLIANAGLGFYLIALHLFVFFSFIPAGLGSIAALAISAFVPSNARRLLWALLALVSVAAVWFCVRLLGMTEGSVASSYAWAYDILAKVRFTQSPLVPSFWVTEGLVHSARGNWREALLQLGLVSSTGLMATQVAVWASQWLYRVGWSRVAGSSQKRRYLGRRWLKLSGRGIVLRLLMDKDFTIFRRDPVQWSQCAILFGLLAIYILNLRAFPFQTQKAIWRSMTSFLNLTATSLVLATLTTRFIFPLLSLEGRRFWILGLLPIKRETILYGKFWFSLAVSVAVSEVLIVLSNVMLETSKEIRILHVVTVALICTALSGMSVGLSAVYPNLREENPSKIVSGFGGTLNLVLSLLYVLLVVAVEAVPCHLYLSHQIGLMEVKLWAGLGLAIILVLTGVAAALPMWLGVRAIRRMEV